MIRLPPLSRSLFVPAYAALPLRRYTSRETAQTRNRAHAKAPLHPQAFSPHSILGRHAFNREAEPDPVMATPERRAFPETSGVTGKDGSLAGSADEKGQRDGVEIPRMLYGTAWKKDNTERLVKRALLAGFKGIDTACQPKHYNEPGVGRGIQAFLKEKNVPRSSLFIQTKFTPIDGQDTSKPLPYDPHAPVTEQVKQSLQTSLENLQVDYLDGVLLHSPLRTTEKTLEAWRALEEAVDQGVVRLIGLSNCYDIVTLRRIYVAARHKPRLLQNRFYADMGYDKEIREFCEEHGLVYEAFWTLTANRHILRSTAVRDAAMRFNCTPEQAWFRYLLEKGLVVLTGTTSEAHMCDDLEVLNLEFSAESFDAVDQEVEQYT